MENKKRILVVSPHPYEEKLGVGGTIAKFAALKCYESQISDFPGPRSIEAVEALAKFRGTQAGFGYGEGFHIVRMIS